MLVTTDNFQESIEWLKKPKLLVVDTETNYVDFQWQRYLMGIAFSGVFEGEERSFYFPFKHSHTLMRHDQDVNLPEELIPQVVELIAESKTIWHNGKFDLRQLEPYWPGNLRTYFYYDTLLLSFMENENKFSHELEVLAKLVGDEKLGDMINKAADALGDGDRAAGWIQLPPSLMSIYAERDCTVTWKLFKLFWPRIKEQELVELYHREVEEAHMIREMEDRGVPVQVEKLQAQVETTQLEIDTLIEELGFEPSKPAQLAHRLYAVPPDGLGFLPAAYSKRKSKEFSQGIPIMDSSTLARLNHPEVEKILRWRKIDKAQSAYYRGWLDKLSPEGKLHANFKQHGTVTTRWSCEKPNLQQLPRDQEATPVKKLLGTLEGYELWEFDYSQVELRLGSLYAGCLPLISTYREGGDVHKITAQNIGAYDKWPTDPDKARYIGKQSNFLTVYGGGAGVLQTQLWGDGRIDMPLATCKEILKQFHDAYPEFRKVMKGCENKARAHGYIKYWNGRRRHFDVDYDCKKAFNSLVQGGAVQIMVESMLKLWKLGYLLVAQVHDAVWILIPKDQVEIEVPKIKSIMEWPSEAFELPFPVDAKCLAA